MKYHFIYQITNKINGSFYRGKHSTNNLNDGYMGSGFNIKKAIKKYGKHNFIKEILCFCDSEQDAYELEELAVTIDDVKNRNCYNASVGGYGSVMTGLHHSDETKRKIGESNSGKRYKKNKPFSDETKRKMSEAKKGKPLTKEHNENIRKSQAGPKHPLAKKISQYTLDGEFVKDYLYIKEASYELNIDPSSISRCCNGLQKTAGRFIFKYKGK